MKWSVGSKIGGGFAVAFAALIVVGATSYLSTRKLLDTSQWVSHTHQVLEKLEGVLSLLKDAETGQRGYLLTGEDHYLEPYNARTRRAPQAVKDVALADKGQRSPAAPPRRPGTTRERQARRVAGDDQPATKGEGAGGPRSGPRRRENGSRQESHGQHSRRDRSHGEGRARPARSALARCRIQPPACQP